MPRLLFRPRSRWCFSVDSIGGSSQRRRLESYICTNSTPMCRVYVLRMRFQHALEGHPRLTEGVQGRDERAQLLLAEVVLRGEPQVGHVRQGGAGHPSGSSWAAGARAGGRRMMV